MEMYYFLLEDWYMYNIYLQLKLQLNWNKNPETFDNWKYKFIVLN